MVREKPTLSPTGVYRVKSERRTWVMVLGWEGQLSGGLALESCFEAVVSSWETLGVELGWSQVNIRLKCLPVWRLDKCQVIQG